MSCSEARQAEQGIALLSILEFYFVTPYQAN
jgi:hypothetical protein